MAEFCLFVSFGYLRCRVLERYTELFACYVQFRYAQLQAKT